MSTQALGDQRSRSVHAESDQRSAKSILVTGAAGSIGQAIVGEFTALGHRVFGIDVLPPPQQSALDGYLELNLADLVHCSPQEREKLVSDALTWCQDSGLDVLVNNAAVQVLGPFEELDVEAWSTSLDVNLLAPFFLVKSLLSPLEQVRGAVVNISSIHARLTKPGFVAYATTKAALSGLTRAMAVDLGPRIRVNAIEPASVETPMLMASFEGNPEAFRDLVGCHPQARLATPSEIASLVYTVSLGSFRSLHGACIDISGGVSSRLHDPL